MERKVDAFEIGDAQRDENEIERIELEIARQIDRRRDLLLSERDVARDGITNDGVKRVLHNR